MSHKLKDISSNTTNTTSSKTTTGFIKEIKCFILLMTEIPMSGLFTNCIGYPLDSLNCVFNIHIKPEKPTGGDITNVLGINTIPNYTDRRILNTFCDKLLLILVKLAILLE